MEMVVVAVYICLLTQKNVHDVWVGGTLGRRHMRMISGLFFGGGG